MADGIPPWLNIDPLRPVQFYLQGTNTGVGAAEARNRAQAAAMELAQRAAAQQAANERAALAAQADAAQTAARIQEINQQRVLNEQKAAAMAKQYAASNNIRAALARGVPGPQAYYENPDFFIGAETAIPGLMRETQPAMGALEKDIRFMRGLDPKMTDEQAAALARAKMMGRRMTIRTRPDGTFELIEGAGDDVTTQPTTGQAGRLQEDIRQKREQLDIIGDLRKNLQWKDVGVAGVFGEWALDRILPNFGANTADLGRIDRRQKLKILVQGAIREVSSDQRFSNADRDDAKGTLPESGIFENFDRAKQGLKTIDHIFAKRNILNRRDLGFKEADFVKEMPLLSNQEIAEAVALKLLPLDVAYQELQRRPSARSRGAPSMVPLGPTNGPINVPTNMPPNVFTNQAYIPTIMGE